MHRLNALLHSLPVLFLFGTGVAPFSTRVYAQAISGDLVGTVADASGAVVPNATVTAINAATSARTTASTNTSGLYRLAKPMPGHYNILAEAARFDKAIMK